MDDSTFNEYLARYKNAISALARKLARRDQELFEDLRQEGMIALWNLDPQKARDNEDAWLRQALWNKMVSFLRRERRRAFDSLDSLLERGAQVVEEGGEVTMVAPVSRKPRRTPDWDGPEEE